jgi:hypothetical protein
MDEIALATAIGVAEGQYSFITWEQALAAGLTAVVIRRLVEQGHWAKVGRGLYRIKGARETWRSGLKAICLRAGQPCAISHRSAAALWGIEGFHPSGTVHITVPRRRRPRFDDVVVHRRDLPRITERDGIPITPIPETILDLCTVSRDESIPLRALDDVRRRRLARPYELRRCLSEHTGRGHPGSALYRALLERRLGRTPPGTVIAAEVLDLLVGAGLPEPEPEVWVTIGGRRYRIDLAYRRPKIAIECLGKIGHLNEKAFEEDPVRNNDFAIDGWLQLHVTWWRVQGRPDRVVADVKEALACRGGA